MVWPTAEKPDAKAAREEANARILQMWEAGASGGEIAAEMGRSRCAIMGVVNRAQKAGRIDMRRRKGKAPYTPRPKAERPAPALKPMPTPTPRQRPLFLEPIVDVTEGQFVAPGEDGVFPGISMLEIKAGQCRWPAGRDALNLMSFCGADTCRPTSSYCAQHHRLVYVPASQRVREANAIDYRPKPKFTGITLQRF